MQSQDSAGRGGRGGDRGRGGNDRGRGGSRGRGGERGAGRDRERGNRGGAGRDRAGRDGQHEERTGGRRGPAGIEKATMRPDAPPRAAVIRGAAAPKEKVQEPPLAADAPIDMPKGTQKDIARVAGDKATADRLLQHLTVVLTALDDRDGRTALPHARYLKARLPRTGLLRELLGTALYLEEDYPAALSELAAYRRITGNQDRNHLVADALRAVGENEDRIPELVEAMEDEDQDVDEAARFEGRIVWASWLADKGDIGAARAVLAPLLDRTVETPEEHHLRLWYVAGDLAERGDDDEAARSWFGRVSAEADGFFDTDERLDRLTP